MAQKPKELIDTGIKGNTGTGDIIYDGGVKLNSNLDQLYNVFGDHRLYEINQGIGQQLLHATGYYQKHPASYYNMQAVEMGSMHDIDTAGGILVVRLPKGKPGESIEFVNSNGTLSATSPLRIVPDELDIVEGHNTAIDISIPYSKTVFWCIESKNGISTWKYRTESMYGNLSMPINSTYILGNTPLIIPVIGYKSANAIKFLLTAQSSDAKSVKSCETLLVIDHINKEVHVNEYGVISFGDNQIYSIKYYIDGSDQVCVEVKPDHSGAKIAIKTTDVIKIGD